MKINELKPGTIFVVTDKQLVNTNVWMKINNGLCLSLNEGTMKQFGLFELSSHIGSHPVEIKVITSIEEALDSYL